MAEPVSFQIIPRGSLWVLTRDGVEIQRYGHVDRAVHEAVQVARELEETGQPARVSVEAADGKVIDVRLDPVPASRIGPQEHTSIKPGPH
jgi:hypothetical protein